MSLVLPTQLIKIYIFNFDIKDIDAHDIYFDSHVDFHIALDDALIGVHIDVHVVHVDPHHDGYD